MVDFIDTLVSGFLANVIGGSTSQTVEIGMIVLVLGLIMFMLASGLDFRLVIVIGAPAVIAAVFDGMFPAAGLGVIILLLGWLAAMLIFALIK